ncbi:MAG: extracellular solute-binding protein [Euzebyales bacterium]|nr:extracellular solute-binding protein [Euzebyales bacterium]MBA3621275.1 extracellular solute-binding protein [Euzebyales bacterium]
MRRSTMLAPWLLALVTTGVLAAACAPSTGADDPAAAGGSESQAGEATDAAGDETTGAAADETTLSVWSWRPEDKAAYKRIFDAYEAEHPGVTVEFKPYLNTEYNTILATGLTEEGGPDVAQLRAYGQLQPLVEAGELTALDGEVPELDDFAPEVLEGAKGREDDKLYGVPFAVQTMQIFYNKQMFDDAGVAEPKTWDEFVAALETFKQDGVMPIATTGKDTWMLPILHDTVAATRYGGQEFQAALQSGETDFTDPDYVASIEVVDQLKPFLPPDVAGVAYTDAQTLFTTGKAAMYPGGSFELGFFRTQAPDMEIGVFSVPPPPGSPVDTPLVPGWADGSWGVNADSPDREAALELVRWMASQEFGQQFTDELGQISAVPGTEPTDEVLAEIVDAYAEHPAPYLLLVDYRYGEPMGTDLMAEGMQELLLGKAEPADVAKKVDSGIAQWFEPQGG